MTRLKTVGVFVFLMAALYALTSNDVESDVIDTDFPEPGRIFYKVEYRENNFINHDVGELINGVIVIDRSEY